MFAKLTTTPQLSSQVMDIQKLFEWNMILQRHVRNCWSVLSLKLRRRWSMELEYLPTWKPQIEYLPTFTKNCLVHVGKYSNPMDPMGDRAPKNNLLNTDVWCPVECLVSCPPFCFWGCAHNDATLNFSTAGSFFHLRFEVWKHDASTRVYQIRVFFWTCF